jgi:protein-disulfide isomerase
LSRFIPSLALIALLLAPLTAPGTADAAIVSLDDAKSEMTMGKTDAPVTIIEFSSLGCPHCARFHKDTLPQIKKDYIDTGKVRLIFQDFPLGTPALAASMIARCSGPKKFFGFIEILFRSQAQWSNSKNPMQALSQVARFGGMSEADVQACLKYQPLLEHIRQGALVGQEKYKVNSTPSFVIGGEIISGAHPFEVFQKAIEKALK